MKIKCGREEGVEEEKDRMGGLYMYSCAQRYNITEVLLQLPRAPDSTFYSTDYRIGKIMHINLFNNLITAELLILKGGIDWPCLLKPSPSTTLSRFKSWFAVDDRVCLHVVPLL